jgi:hypothetical protein
MPIGTVVFFLFSANSSSVASQDFHFLFLIEQSQKNQKG